jgi:hypothetical protein
MSQEVYQRNPLVIRQGTFRWERGLPKEFFGYSTGFRLGRNDWLKKKLSNVFLGKTENNECFSFTATDS